MTYAEVDGGADASDTLPQSGRVDWTWREVEDRLVDALDLWRRSYDRDCRFSLSGRISSVWRQCVDDPLALIERHGIETETPRPLPLSRGDMARMTEASEWMRFVPDHDRRLVIIALTYLLKGYSRVPWLKLKHRLGIKFGAEGVRKRYSRGLEAIASALNGANPPR